MGRPTNRPRRAPRVPYLVCVLIEDGLWEIRLWGSVLGHAKRRPDGRYVAHYADMSIMSTHGFRGPSAIAQWLCLSTPVDREEAIRSGRF